LKFSFRALLIQARWHRGKRKSNITVRSVELNWNRPRFLEAIGRLCNLVHRTFESRKALAREHREGVATDRPPERIPGQEQGRWFHAI